MDLESWKESASSFLGQSAFAVKRLLPDTAYGYLCSAAVWPVVTAISQGDMTAFAAPANLAGNVGVNLIANKVQ